MQAFFGNCNRPVSFSIWPDLPIIFNRSKASTRTRSIERNFFILILLFPLPSLFALIGEYAAYDAVENEIALRCIDIASNTTENVFLDCESLKITQEHPEIEINSNISINNADRPRSL